MNGRHQDSVTPLTAVTGIAGMLLGIIVGYMLGVSQNEARPLPVTAAATVPASPALVDEQELQGWRNILASDPQNLRSMTRAGTRTPSPTISRRSRWMRRT